VVNESPPPLASAAASDALGDSRPEFAAVFRAHYPYALRLAASLTGDREQAKDIAQDVFLAVFKGLEGFRGDSQLRTWIYQITLRTAGRHLSRLEKHACQAMELDDLPGIASAEDAAELVELVVALRRLPLDSRTVLSLVAIEGLSHQAVADVLGVPVGTIGSRLHTARRQLIAAMERSGSR
jgi:RNA polymerase sigma-70 factor (ECF subfamily)